MTDDDIAWTVERVDSESLPDKPRYAYAAVGEPEPTVELVPIRMGTDIIGWRVGGQGMLHVSPLDSDIISLPRRLFTDYEAINGADIPALDLWARLTDAGVPIPENIRVEITKA